MLPAWAKAGALSLGRLLGVLRGEQAGELFRVDVLRVLVPGVHQPPKPDLDDLTDGHLLGVRRLGAGFKDVDLHDPVAQVCPHPPRAAYRGRVTESVDSAYSPPITTSVCRTRTNVAGGPRHAGPSR